MIARGIILASLALAACGAPESGVEPLPSADAESFAAEIQPMVTDGCASLDCHGAAGRPLRLYAERGLRLTAALRDQPITAEEIAHNAAAMVGVSPGPVGDHLALLKPLAISAGGMEHIGGDLWMTTEDPAYVALRAWLEAQR